MRRQEKGSGAEGHRLPSGSLIHVVEVRRGHRVDLPGVVVDVLPPDVDTRGARTRHAGDVSRGGVADGRARPGCSARNERTQRGVPEHRVRSEPRRKRRAGHDPGQIHLATEASRNRRESADAGISDEHRHRRGVQCDAEVRVSHPRCDRPRVLLDEHGVRRHAAGSASHEPRIAREPADPTTTGAEPVGGVGAAVAAAPTVVRVTAARVATERTAEREARRTGHDVRSDIGRSRVGPGVHARIGRAGVSARVHASVSGRNVSACVDRRAGPAVDDAARARLRARAHTIAAARTAVDGDVSACVGGAGIGPHVHPRVGGWNVGPGVRRGYVDTRVDRRAGPAVRRACRAHLAGGERAEPIPAARRGDIRSVGHVGHVGDVRRISDV